MSVANPLPKGAPTQWQHGHHRTRLLRTQAGPLHGTLPADLAASSRSRSSTATCAQSSTPAPPAATAAGAAAASTASSTSRPPWPLPTPPRGCGTASPCGEKISGPAARRAVTAAVQAPRFEGRTITRKFAKQAADYLARDGLVLFDNPDASLICVFKRDNALCEPGPDVTAPNQFDCRPGCGNAVRLDSHANELLEETNRINQLAAHAPQPLARRLRAAAEQHRDTADTHHATVQPAEALT